MIQEQKPEPTVLELAKVSADDQVQCRKNLNKEVVEEYAWHMAEGKAFPPIDVFQDGVRYILADGFHRFCAAVKAGRSVIGAIIHEGGIREAKLFAATSNINHGLRRTRADKRKAVTTVLMEEEWRSLTNGEIAKRLAVTSQFVGDVRRDLEATRNDFESPTVRTGSDGRTIDTANIGKKGKAHIPVPRGTDAADQTEEYIAMVEASALIARVRQLGAELRARENRIVHLEKRIADLELELNVHRPPVPAPWGLVEANARIH